MSNQNQKALLEVKEITFSDTKLIAIKDNKTGKVFTSIKKFCDDLGLKDHTKQISKINKDEVLKEGVAILALPSNGGIQDVFCLDIEYIAMWLTSIKPNHCAEEIRPLLIEFKKKAQKVLAKAFLQDQQEQPKFNIPKNFAEALRLSAELAEKNEALETENKELKPQATLLKLFTDTTELKTLKQIGYKLKKYGLGPYKIFDFLRKHHVLTKVNGENYATHNYEKHFKIETLLKKWVDKDTGEEKSKAFDILKMQPSFYKHLAELLVNDGILTINQFNNIDFNDVPHDEACFDFTQKVG